MAEKITKLGKYTLGEQLGSGGFGTVYKASDPSGRTVAIKVLKPGWSDDPGTIERFRRESQVAGELFHSRIATIIDFDQFKGRLFLVMRYIDGISLDKLIQENGRLEWAQALQILEQVADGLDYAHQRGLVHRDVKPANILISEKDGAVLTDFGLVKAADVSGMSTSGVMLGTPHYIAPEIWEGKPATPQTDIYSLACVASEMLTGQVLFAGSSPPEIMTKHVLVSPPMPEHWPEGVPPGIQEVLLCALQRDPNKRYSTASAFIGSLKKTGEALPKEVKEPIKLVIQPVSIVSTPKTAPRPAVSSLGRQRWQEKSIPYLLFLLGLVDIVVGVAFILGLQIVGLVIAFPFFCAGLVGFSACLGFFWRQNWARWAGMLAAGLLEYAGLLAGLGTILLMLLPMPESVIPFLVTILGGGCLAFFGALYLLQVVGGQRMANWTSTTIFRPAGIWQISIAYSVTILGIIPAILLLIRKPINRVLAQGFAVFLLLALPVIGILAGLSMKTDLSGNINGQWATSYTPNYAGQCLTGLAVFSFIGLCIAAILYLNKPEIRAYYEKRTG